MKPTVPASTSAGLVAASFSVTGRVHGQSPPSSTHATTLELNRGLSRSPTTGTPREVCVLNAAQSPRRDPGSPNEHAPLSSATTRHPFSSAIGRSATSHCSAWESPTTTTVAVAGVAGSSWVQALPSASSCQAPRHTEGSEANSARRAVTATPDERALPRDAAASKRTMPVAGHGDDAAGDPQHEGPRAQWRHLRPGQPAQRPLDEPRQQPGEHQRETDDGGAVERTGPGPAGGGEPQHEHRPHDEDLALQRQRPHVL